MNIKCCMYEFVILLSVVNTNVHRVEVSANAQLGFTPVHRIYFCTTFKPVQSCHFWENKMLLKTSFLGQLARKSNYHHLVT